VRTNHHLYYKVYVQQNVYTLKHAFTCLTIRLEEIFARKGLITIARELSSQGPDRQYSIRKLAFRTGMSVSEASAVVKKMAQLGIIKSKPKGRAFMISLNYDNDIWQKILKPILEAEATVTKKTNMKAKDQEPFSSFTSFSAKPEGRSAGYEAVRDWLKHRLEQEKDKILCAVLYGDLTGRANVNLHIIFRGTEDLAIIERIEEELNSRFILQMDITTGPASQLEQEIRQMELKIKYVNIEPLIGADIFSSYSERQ